MSIRAVDLFCGAGGLTYGLQEAGIDVRAGFDIESECRHPYTENNSDVDFVEGDLSDDVSNAEIEEYLSAGEDDYTLIAGCAPCQPYSTMSNGNKNRTEDHEKWGLMDEFAEIVADIQPDLVTMENVPQVQKHDPYDDFCRRLAEAGYHISDRVVDCPNYGVPQQRKRMVLLASKHGRIELQDPTHDPDEVTVESEFSKHNFCELEAGETSDDDFLHNARGLSDTNKKRIRHSQPGGTWKDWPEELLLKCHKKDSGRKYIAPYGRMEWNKPAPTITTQFYNYGSGRFGHPEEDRAISVREGATLQTFPSDYSFVQSEEELSVKSVGKLIGNAVPVRLAEAIGQSLIQHIRNEDPQTQLQTV
ncbi:DNA cytosine methyltransferase [Halorubrum sp. CGM5_25_10-8B]|uniref:DNA cytosine methyltransferase n=1 Tax=Halorubrum sp. CGM5_25_10-8B TaxID=2518115 RepID=UPI0010F5130D|nr:DNA cytosine methyltransferase [Halorubrum sp. CGM5_25_10-8B]TKX35160.1 DNA cytosine methyltransferase [Halorubrum sp. CGM5_25_10-8B]